MRPEPPAGPVEARILPYGRQTIGREDVDAVVDQLGSDWLTQGPRVAELEAALTDVTGARHAVVVSSGTAALHLAALASGIGAGRAGVTSAVTFVASANCIAYTGATPAFADVDPTTGLVDPGSMAARCEALAAAGTPPALLIPVDFAGQPADLPSVRRLADRWGALVIEDAAHSLGACYLDAGREVRAASCTHSDMAILSFHPVKHVTTGEGGAVLTGDGTLARRLRELRSHGITRDPERMTADDGPWYYEQHELGFNYRLTDVQCALGLSQLGRLDAFVARRRALAQAYDRALAAEPFASRLAPLCVLPGRTSAYHLYVIRLKARAGESPSELAAGRRSLFGHLVAGGIRPQVHYVPVPRQPYYRRVWGTDPEDYPGAADLYTSCLSLPLFPAMEEGDVERVVAALGTWLEAS